MRLSGICLSLTYLVFALKVHPSHLTLWQDFLPSGGWITFYCVHMHIIFIHPLTRRLDCFHISTVVTNDAVTRGVKNSLWHSDFIFFGCMPRSGIAGSYGSSIFLIVLRNFHTVLQHGCTKLPSHQEYTKVPFPPRASQHLSSLIFLLTAIVTGARWYLIMVNKFILNPTLWKAHFKQDGHFTPSPQAAHQSGLP